MMPSLNDEERTAAIAAIQAYFLDERDEEVGDLAAGLLLEQMEEVVGRSFYNKGVRDAQALVTQYAGSLEEEIDCLQILATPRV